MKQLVLALLVLGLVCSARGASASHTDVRPVLFEVDGIKTTVDALQSQLDHLPPTWDQILPAADRFVLVMGGAAVLDKETGLVWEQSPDTTVQNWLFSEFFCNGRSVGGRKGWRLPTAQELASLVDPNNPSGNPDLPRGHPFSNVQSSLYWSTTTFAQDPTAAWFVSLQDGVVGTVGKANPHLVWCVRGGRGVDAQ